MPEAAAAPRRPTSWTRCWLEGAGAAILLAPGLLWTELSRTHIDLYHRLLPLNTVARALAVDLALLSIAAMLAIRGLERLTRGSWRGRRVLALGWALWFGLLAARAVSGMITSQVLWWQQATTGRAFLLAAGILLAVWAASPGWYRGAVRLARGGVLLVGFCIFWMIPTLIVAGMARQPYDSVAFARPVAASTTHPRIVWLLFDEMSYDQVFAHRWPGLELPNLDKLRAESVTFSDVEPDGFYTEDVIPSILLGQPIQDVRGTSEGWMLYQSKKHGPWQPFDGRQTLFQTAQDEGWTAGVTGEYNPYCRILKDQLDFCWMGMPPLPDHFSRDQSTMENVAAPLAANWRRLFEQKGEKKPAEDAGVDSIDAVREGDALIEDAGIDLCFVHLPLPHPPGHYDRKTKRIGPGGSYIDNLALSDRVLQNMLGEIAASPASSRTTVILSSDHSWRTWLWRDSFGWTHEDEMASGHGHFDPRPMLMVWFPGETAGTTVARPVPLLSMHGLLLQIMAGRIENPQQLEAWAAQQ